ncbi:MAG: hypothetical protein MI919_35235, partial [Holophagales bacterium]|nr:hypothetical protein [Holophagales bacterium]
MLELLRLRNFVLLACVALFFDSGVWAATSWGTYNPTTRRIVASAGGSSMTISMPFPGTSPGSYTGTIGGSYVYAAGGSEYRLSLSVDGDSLLVAVESDDSVWARVDGGRMITSGTWRRVDVSQYGLHKGHAFNEKASYSDLDQLWVSAFWHPEASDASEWKIYTSPDPPFYSANYGSGNMRLAPDALYHADTSGSRLPVRELLEIRVADSLWGSVPAHPNLPSQYAQELADSIFVDSWSDDSASDLTHFVKVLQRIAGPERLFFTNWARWQAGGFDAHTPDAIWLAHDPPYPPNYAGFGSLSQMRHLAQVAKATGRFSFRTYYSFIREPSPSYQEGLVRYVLDADGSTSAAGFTKLIDIPIVATRQEPEVQQVLG